MHTETRLIPNKDSDGFCYFLMNMEDYSMKQLLSCEFNMDTNCVELCFADGSLISIDTIAVENEVADNTYERSELDYLIYNVPIEYTCLMLNGDLVKYLEAVTELILIHCLMSYSKRGASSAFSCTLVLDLGKL